MFSLLTIYISLFIVSSFLFYMLKLVMDEINNIIDSKLIDYTERINKLEKENTNLKNLNTKSKTFNTKSSIPIIYGCFH